MGKIPLRVFYDSYQKVTQIKYGVRFHTPYTNEVISRIRTPKYA